MIFDRKFLKSGVSARAIFAVAASLSVAACGSQTTSSSGGGVEINNKTKFSSKAYGVSASPRLIKSGRKKVPKGGGRYQVGKPYKIKGRWYKPKHEPGYNKTGLASWYGPNFHGRQTANGEIYDSTALSAAHPTLPLPSYARVTNLENKRSVIVRVNDRGPFAPGRIIDLSSRTADLLGTKAKGVVKVRVQYVGKARLDGLDERYLVASYKGPGSARQKTPLLKRREAPVVEPQTLIAKAAPPAPETPATRPVEPSTDVLLASGSPLFASQAYQTALASIQSQPTQLAAAPATSQIVAQPAVTTLASPPKTLAAQEAIIRASQPVAPASNTQTVLEPLILQPNAYAAAATATRRVDAVHAIAEQATRSMNDSWKTGKSYSSENTNIQIGYFADGGNVKKLQKALGAYGTVETSNTQNGLTRIVLKTKDETALTSVKHIVKDAYILIQKP